MTVVHFHPIETSALVPLSPCMTKGGCKTGQIRGQWPPAPLSLSMDGVRVVIAVPKHHLQCPNPDVIRRLHMEQRRARGVHAKGGCYFPEQGLCPESLLSRTESKHNKQQLQVGKGKKKSLFIGAGCSGRNLVRKSL